ncbi:MAG TPA: glycosyltransferase [Rhodanobacteraceae bacterium]|nr:glycosyltransferase [Rhodanobacteraceae bacterium]
MRIVVDLQACQSLPHRDRGIGRYSMALTKALLRNAGDDDDIWVALNGEIGETIEPVRAALSGLIDQRRIAVWKSASETALISRANEWRHAAAVQVRDAFLAQLKPDVVHISSLFEGYHDDVVTSVSVGQPFLTSVSLYDLIPLAQADTYLTDPRLREWYMGRLEELRQASLMLGISSFTCREAVERLQIPASRAVPVMAAADPMFRQIQIAVAKSQALLARLGITKRFVMYTGGIDPRKNIEGLIDAYSQLPGSLRHELQLVIVCEARPDQRERLQALAVQRGLLADQLVVTGYVSDADLVALYNLCQVFVFPSLSEGFGLPALEAMSCGAAVIASNTTSLPEVIGDPDALFDPHDAASIAGKLRAVLTDERLLARLREHGLRRAQDFSWDRCAQASLAAMRGTLDRRDGNRRAATGISSAASREKPLLAYISPLPPQRSGIADYSAELLPALSEYYRIETVSDQLEVTDPWVREHIPLHDYEWFEQNASRYDRVLYHLGNSAMHARMPTTLERHPGVVVLHEVFLSGLTSHLELASKVPGYWTRSLYESHGYQALADRKVLGNFERILQRYPCSLPLIRDAEGIIVHTQYCKGIAEHWFGEKTSHDWTVVPHLRAIPDRVPREQARRQLGLGDGDLLVCCFGVLGPFKRNLELLEGWVASSLGNDHRCHLVFVGAAHSPEYGDQVQQAVAERHLEEQVRVTGWADAQTYRTYLAAADIAVQLRGSSRGEASGTVLDCLAYGIPTIVNAHGPMAELPSEILIKIPDAFAATDLATALERLAANTVTRRELGQLGRNYCRDALDPKHIASLYHDAIEKITTKGSHRALARLADGITRIQGQPSREDFERLAIGIAANQRPAAVVRQLLVDVSELVRRDAKSGIQRVVKSLLGVLLRQPPSGFRVEPVYANPGQHYRYARTFTAEFLDLNESMPPDEPIDTDAGDVFLGLDLAPEEIPANGAEFEAMRQCGVRVCFVVYDQLPMRRSDCFPPGTYDLFNRWMSAIARSSDGLICISRAVEDEVRQHLDTMQVSRARPLRLGHFHLGADIESSKPSNGITSEQRACLEQLRSAPSFLVVGTIEPRKGHAQALDAFENLWARGQTVNLVLVGKAGWMTEALVQRIRDHAENGKRLVWFEQASDELLLQLFAACAVLLAPSEGEGFGLPLIEAAKYGLPILCRDLAVFREVAGEHATYFSGYASTDLADAVTHWLSLNKAGTVPPSRPMPRKNWEQSARDLLSIALDDDWDGAWMPAENYWFPAYDPRIETGVGRRARGRVVAGGSGGTIFQTHAMEVADGQYRLQVSGDWLATSGTAQVDLFSSVEHVVLASFELVAALHQGTLILDATLELPSGCADLSIRIVASDDAFIAIDGCGLRPLDPATGGNGVRPGRHVGKRRVLVDITEITRLDAKTGVQRVTRNFFAGLKALALEQGTFEVEPFCWTEGSIRHAREFARTRLGIPCVGSDEPVRVQPRDLVFMLDSSWWSPERFDDLHARVHAADGEVVWMVHDLIPIRFPELCGPGMPLAFNTWLTHAVLTSDGFVCNSEATRSDLESFISEMSGIGLQRPWTRVVQLGCDLGLDAAAPAPEKSAAVRAAIGKRPYFVALGTLEPRKDYKTIIDAFELLWTRGVDVALVIVGRQGWNVEVLVDRINLHPELRQRLYWIPSGGDNDVRNLLEGASALIQASIWEGFGLPLIEAGSLGVALVASDIAVFREIAGNSATYFPVGNATALSRIVRDMLDGERTRDSSGIRYRSWGEASLQLADVLGVA